MKPTLTPEDAEKFSKREVIKDDDSTAHCTKTGWDRWKNYRRNELQKMKDKK